MSLYPMFLKLEGRRCLVVGAGAVGLEKVVGLLRCGASLRVIAPEAVPAIEALAAGGRLEWLARRFLPGDLAGFALVIAATNDREVNRSVFEEASQRSILSNTADDPPLCDFFLGSIVQRGDLQIAISTAGKSPALAQRLRRGIDALLAADAGRWLDDLGELRGEALAAMPAGEDRKRLLHDLAQRDVCSAPACPARQYALAVAEELREAERRLEEAPR